MIRGNYSLSKEVRKNEQKNKQKIQARQKHQSKLEQLSSADPIRIFHQIEKLEQIDGLDVHQQKRLAKLRQDWAFIKKNELFKEKVTAFLGNREKIKEAKEKEQRKLRGKDSIYFNPELNPLGKLPDIHNVTEQCDPFLNIAKPVKSFHEYPQDSLIRELGIKPPAGEPPKFYKTVQNTARSTPSVNVEKASTIVHDKSDDYRRTLDTDSGEESVSDA